MVYTRIQPRCELLIELTQKVTFNANTCNNKKHVLRTYPLLLFLWLEFPSPSMA